MMYFLSIGERQSTEERCRLIVVGVGSTMSIVMRPTAPNRGGQCSHMEPKISGLRLGYYADATRAFISTQAASAVRGALSYTQSQRCPRLRGRRWHYRHWTDRHGRRTARKASGCACFLRSDIRTSTTNLSGQPRRNLELFAGRK